MAACPQCQSDNPPGARFCNDCGARLDVLCTRCGHTNTPGARFCSHCGQAFQPAGGPGAAPAVPATEPTPPRRVRQDAERRQITVLFADLVGSTPLSQRLDPEDLRFAVRAYQETSSAIIARFEGHIATYLGDGLLVYFGYPTAHEDAAERAVRAALSMVAAMPSLNERLQARLPLLRELPLRLRIGIHTGLVVAGEMGGRVRREPLAIVGETPNIAARLQGEAAPDTVVVSDDTRRLVEGLFEFAALGPRTMKGVAAPMPLHRVLREHRAAPQRDQAPRGYRGPLVGREQELGLLLDRWDMAKEQLGQVVLLSGDAGIGKTRLLRELKERLDAPPEWRLYARCSAYHGQTPFYPIIDLFERALRFQRDQSPEDRLLTFEQALRPYALDFDGIVPFLAEHLSFPPSRRASAPALSPEQHRRRVLEAFVAVLNGISARHPLFLSFEDLHWIDPSSLEVVDLLIEQAPTARLLLVMTARPTFHPSWSPRSHLSQMTLNRFPRRHVEQVIAHMSGSKPLPLEVVAEIVTKSDGVPLFAEELTKYVLESGLVHDKGGQYTLEGPLQALAIPSTLQDSLMARLDRLAPVKEVAQIGATIGRTFSHALIRAVSGFDEGALKTALTQLVGAEVIYQRGLGDDALYIFKHALTRDAAYNSLLKETRRLYHQRVAATLLEQSRDVAGSQPEVIAHHYSEAGHLEPAASQWQRAGALAIRRSAYIEAGTHLRKAQEALGALPSSPGRDELELEVCSSLGTVLVATRGQSSPETLATYSRARELCERLGDQARLVPVLIGLRRFYSVRAELATARSLADQLLRTAHATGNRDILPEAEQSAANVALWLGDFVAARTHAETAVGRAAGEPPAAPRVPYSVTSPVVSALAYLSWALWVLGYPSQSLDRARQAMRLAEELDHPHSMAVAMDFAIAVHEFRGEAAAARELADRAIQLCDEHSFPFWKGLGTVRRGWAIAELGDADAGVAEMQRGLTTWQGTGARLAKPFLWSFVADAYSKRGDHAEGRRLVAEAIEAGRHTGEQFFLAELHRLDGELLLREAPDAVDEAQALFEQALTVARSQRARSLELRVALSLGRLWARHGRRDRARDLLGTVYGFFSEGFDTRDLREAAALLDELAAPPGSGDITRA